MTIKFQASYKVTVYSNTDTVIVKSPITCKFNISRGVFTQSTKATIQLYNLAPSTRNKIFQDVFTLDPMKQKYIHLEAGYGDGNSLSMIFKGRILQAYSRKSGGQTDIITEIQAQALDVFDCQTSQTFAAGTSFKDAYNTIAQDLPNITIGNTGALDGTFQTTTTFDGNTLEQLNKLSGGHSFVDNGVLNTIMDNEVIEVPVPVITNDNALLETPVRRDANLEIKMLFEPSLIVGQLLEVKSEVFSDFNGQYKVVGFSHDCMISETQSGTRITTVTLWIGSMLPGANIALTGEKTQNNFNKVKGNKVVKVDSSLPSSIADVYTYIQKNNGKIPNTKITPNISWREMIGNNNTNADRKKECTLGVLANVYTTAKTLQKVINTYYRGYTITINSGWRSTRNNKNCGGQPKSKHLYGLACDFKINGISTWSVYKKMLSVWPGWSGYYRSGNFVHVQIASTKGIANDR